ncbi:MAG: AAA family ATPase [Gammaproteobacteria bacterium]|nr:AAA family ATPase [Gammaproteobacteria bacterium]
MIIRSIHASNVLKYAKLDLDNLPEKGKIAISGANESGKTAIVETISFALFGQTFSNSIDDINRTVRWGESSCSVELVFTARGNESYTIFRSCDKEGMHSAELFITGEDAPFASGPQAVQDEIYKVCGFDFEQYLDSLYLAQMEITSSASQTGTIMAISGASPVEAVRNDLIHEINTEQDAITSIEQEQNRIREQIASLNIQEDRFSEIAEVKNQCNDQAGIYKEEINDIQTISTNIREAGVRIQESGHAMTTAGRDISVNEWKERLDQLADSIETMGESVGPLEMESGLRSGNELKRYLDKLQAHLSSFEPVIEQGNVYREELAALRGERGKKPDDGSKSLPKQQSRLKRHLLSQRFYSGFMKGLFILFIPLTVLLWTGWWLLVQSPDTSMSVKLSGWLSQQTSWWDQIYLSSLMNSSIAALLITFFIFFMSRRTKSRISQLSDDLSHVVELLQSVNNKADLLDGIQDRPFPAVIAGLQKFESKPLMKALERFTENKGRVFFSEQTFADHQMQLNSLLDESANNVATLRESIATQTGKLNRLIDEQYDKISKLEREIEDIQIRKKEASDLNVVIDNMEPSLNEHKLRSKVRGTALKLATGTCSNIYAHFNQVLSKYTAIVMPRLTEGRYKQIQIDDDLTVRVFSTEKNDFAVLSELSSGTQRQIMLALRLAISKALVEAGQQGKQFIVLDEPFAFFDRDRIRNTIKSLTDLDKSITQFWVITQEFESPKQFELTINCSCYSDELLLTGA